MNAKEARERSLWNKLFPPIREQIEKEVNGGWTSATIYSYILVDKDRDILTDLGYSVTYEDGAIIVEW